MTKRFALCMSGYFSNSGHHDLTKTQYIHDNVINRIGDQNTIDIFIHSFDIANKANILAKYPTVQEYCIEPQIDFIATLDEENKQFVNEIEKHRPGQNLQTVLSACYGRRQAIGLANDYAIQNHFVYDSILWCRFDIGIRMSQPHRGFNPCKFVLDPTLDMSYNYSAFWDQLNAGFADHWLISNHSSMVLFSFMYDYILQKAFKLESQYIKDLSNWPNSNIKDEFSNEMLQKREVPTTNVQHHLGHVYNLHLLMKHYFLTSGLYTTSRFLDYTKT